jgi:hypothetical protein
MFLHRLDDLFHRRGIVAVARKNLVSQRDSISIGTPKRSSNAVTRYHVVSMCSSLEGLQNRAMVRMAATIGQGISSVLGSADFCKSESMSKSAFRSVVNKGASCRLPDALGRPRQSGLYRQTLPVLPVFRLGFAKL